MCNNAIILMINRLAIVSDRFWCLEIGVLVNRIDLVLSRRERVGKIYDSFGRVL